MKTSSLPRSGGRGAEAEVSITPEGGLPFKGAVPSPPRHRSPTRSRWGSGVGVAGWFCRGVTGQFQGLPPRTRTHTSAHTRARTALPVPVRGGPRRRKPATRTSQGAPWALREAPKSLLQSTFRVEGSSKRTTRATASPLQETGDADPAWLSPALAGGRPPIAGPAPAPAATLPTPTHLGRSGGGGRRSRCGPRQAGAASSAAGRTRGHGPRRRRAGAVPAAPFRPRSTRLRRRPLTARLGRAAQ